MFGDVFICRFPFTSGVISKPRPALVLFELSDDLIICRVTSVLRSGPCDVVLEDWQVAGLAKASVARIDRVVTAERSVLGQRLGSLSARDATAVRERWNLHMRL